MESIRRINTDEKKILEYLIKKAKLDFSNETYQGALVQKMDDGGMGSFRIFYDPSEVGLKKSFGRQASEFEFIDDDGVLVLVSLNVDDHNKPFEVDVWKIDFNPVINFKIPH